MKILLRYDDYSEISNIGVDLAVFEAMVSRGFKPLVGVIPAIADVNWELGNSIPLKRLSQERINLLKPFVSAGLEIALHGYTHQAVTRLTGLFEFGDAVSFDKQVERLRDGKHFLEDSFGVAVNWFIPPWNAYGETTLRAIKACGFQGISADASFGPISDGLCFASASCLPREIPQVLACAKKNDQADIVVVLHDFDFKESRASERGISISDFGKMLDQVKDNQIKGCAFSQLVENDGWGVSRALANQNLRKYTTGPLRFLSHPGVVSIYFSEDAAKKKLAHFDFYSRTLKGVLGGYRKVLYVGKK